MLAGDELRPFLARVLGWSDERRVELALRSLALALDHRATLVLCGEGDSS
jgi:adenylylsulfate kinase-like enzyme